MKQKLAELLLTTLHRRVVARRPPDVIIGGDGNPYLLRWHVIPRNRFCNIYLHRFVRSDDDRALHCHPWMNASFLLEGQYREHLQGGVAQDLRQGAVRVRWSGRLMHRIELTHGPCWTLFITGPRYREWGFYCPQGFVHWRDFTDPSDPGRPGKGCDQ